MALPQNSLLFDFGPLTPADLPSRAEMERLFAASDQEVFDQAFAPGAEYPQGYARRTRSEEDEILMSAFR